MRCLAPLVLAACVPPGHADRSLFDPRTPPPRIEAVRARCDPEAGTWRVDVTTDAWAGGAVLLWTLDGVYVERHDGFRSVAAHPEGLGDTLRADLGIVADFRGAANGRSAFTCREAPTAALWVLDLDREPSDCMHGGPEPELVLGLEGLPPCEATWNPPPDPEDSDDPDAEGA